VLGHDSQTVADRLNAHRVRVGLRERKPRVYRDADAPSPIPNGAATQRVTCDKPNAIDRYRVDQQNKRRERERARRLAFGNNPLPPSAFLPWGVTLLSWLPHSSAAPKKRQWWSSLTPRHRRLMESQIAAQASFDTTLRGWLNDRLFASGMHARSVAPQRGETYVDFDELIESGRWVNEEWEQDVFGGWEYRPITVVRYTEKQKHIRVDNYWWTGLQLGVLKIGCMRRTAVSVTTAKPCDLCGKECWTLSDVYNLTRTRRIKAIPTTRRLSCCSRCKRKMERVLDAEIAVCELTSLINQLEKEIQNVRKARNS